MKMLYNNLFVVSTLILLISSFPVYGYADMLSYQSKIYNNNINESTTINNDIRDDVFEPLFITELYSMPVWNVDGTFNACNSSCVNTIVFISCTIIICIYFIYIHLNLLH